MQNDCDRLSRALSQGALHLVSKKRENRRAGLDGISPTALRAPCKTRGVRSCTRQTTNSPVFFSQKCGR